MTPQEFLASVFLRLADIPTDDLNRMIAKFTPLTLEKDAHFLLAGDVPTRIGFLVSGLMRMYYVDLDGNEYTKSIIPAGDFITSHSALILREPSPLYIRAEQPSQILVLSYEDYEQLDAPHWQIVRRKLVERLYIKKEKRERQLLLDDATTRYLTFLEEFPDLEDQIQQYHIASYLGITPVSLSRIRASLRDEKSSH